MTALIDRVVAVFTSAIPTPFLVLCTINVAFWAILIWHENTVLATRIQQTHELIQACIAVTAARGR